MTEIGSLIDKLKTFITNPSVGLPEEIFLFVSEITPLVNVDLLIKDDNNRVLLAWRNDRWYGSGWHVPGGIIRVGETFEERIQKCAEQEIHSHVEYNSTPLEVHPIIESDFIERKHFVSFVYSCKLPAYYKIDNGILDINDTGYLAWHSHYPDDMLRCHQFYRKYFKK